VAPGSFYVEGGVLWGIMDMIDRAFQIGFLFDDDDNELRNIAAGFSKFSHGHLRHCVLAVD
jgi:hypothetical protein